jgi:hypothetical protein
MPRKDRRTVELPAEVYELLREEAEEHHLTITAMVQFHIDRSRLVGLDLPIYLDDARDTRRSLDLMQRDMHAVRRLLETLVHPSRWPRGYTPAGRDPR